mmetsp:Transcript_38317/g.86027  ORF Transcript_38317/g.86027 Transcript_38317/m.86027 type:complete len:222 (-) Transcript_38317:1037-1702(-)
MSTVSGSRLTLRRVFGGWITDAPGPENDMSNWRLCEGPGGFFGSRSTVSLVEPVREHPTSTSRIRQLSVCSGWRPISPAAVTHSSELVRSRGRSCPGCDGETVLQSAPSPSNKAGGLADNVASTLAPGITSCLSTPPTSQSCPCPSPTKTSGPALPSIPSCANKSDNPVARRDFDCLSIHLIRWSSCHSPCRSPFADFQLPTPCRRPFSHGPSYSLPVEYR